MDEGLQAAEQTGAAGADATDGGQVGMMEDRQLDGQTAPDAARNHRKEKKPQTLEKKKSLRQHGAAAPSHVSHAENLNVSLFW